VRQITFVNASPTMLCAVFAGPSSRPDWGANLLGPDEMLLPLDSFAVTAEQADEPWDLKALDCDGGTVEEIYRQPLPASGTWEIQVLEPQSPYP
jgi:hypothetical protein